MISNKEQGSCEQPVQDETQKQPMGSSSSGAESGKGDGFEYIAKRRSRRVI